VPARAVMSGWRWMGTEVFVLAPSDGNIGMWLETPDHASASSGATQAPDGPAARALAGCLRDL
jgi:hypothetical protein